MKQILLIGFAGILTSAGVSAVEPTLLPEFYTSKISSDGKWLANDGGAGGMVIYNVTERTSEYFEEFFQGNGNSLNNAGTLVGSYGESGAIILNNKMVIPTGLADYEYSNLHGITADGSRACGVVTGNIAGYENRTYVATVFDLDAKGQITKTTYLPVPPKDLFGNDAQYTSAIWISNDGKTIVGQEIDEWGQFIVPIVYTEGADGTWSYNRPSEKFFNPDGLTMPEFPGEFELTPPEAKDYMTEAEYAAWEEAYDAWVDGGFSGEYPEYDQYMTEEEIEAYNDAADKYNAAAADYQAKYEEYATTYAYIVNDSGNFIQGACTLASDGNTFLSTAIKVEDTGDYWPAELYQNYQFDLASGSYSIIPQKISDQIMANQILSGGVIFGSTPSMGMMPPQTFVYVPGAEDFVLLEDFLQPENPDLYAWMNENLLNKVEVDYDPETYDPIYEDIVISGHGLACDDLSVISGGIPAYYFEEGPLSEYTYASYLFTNVDVVSVETVEAANVKVNAYKGGVIVIEGGEADIDIFNTAGQRVYRANGAIGTIHTGLAAGMYIVKVADTTFKVIF